MSELRFLSLKEFNEKVEKTIKEKALKFMDKPMTNGSDHSIEAYINGYKQAIQDERDHYYLSMIGEG